MSDGINRVGGSLPPHSVGRGEKIDRNKNPEKTDSDTPRVNDQHSASHATPIEELTLSLPTARMIVRNESPPEVRAALEGFAPLGELNGAEIFCDIIERKGRDSFGWPNTLTLRQALEVAASA